MNSIHDITVKDRKGASVPLNLYANEVVLIVNTATKSSFTPQYADLQALYRKYHAQGFEVLDFPLTNPRSRVLVPMRWYTSSARTRTARSSHASRR